MKKFVFLSTVLCVLMGCLLLMSGTKAASIIEDVDMKRDSLASLFGSMFSMGEDNNTDERDNKSEEVDWSKVKFKEIKFESKETGMRSEQLFEKVRKCIEKCMHQKHVDLRDNCVALNCDIY